MTAASEPPLARRPVHALDTARLRTLLAVNDGRRVYGTAVLGRSVRILDNQPLYVLYNPCCYVVGEQERIVYSHLWSLISRAEASKLQVLCTFSFVARISAYRRGDGSLNYGLAGLRVGGVETL